MLLVLGGKIRKMYVLSVFPESFSGVLNFIYIYIYIWSISEVGLRSLRTPVLIYGLPVVSQYLSS